MGRAEGDGDISKAARVDADGSLRNELSGAGEKTRFIAKRGKGARVVVLVDMLHLHLCLWLGFCIVLHCTGLLPGSLLIIILLQREVATWPFESNNVQTHPMLRGYAFMCSKSLCTSKHSLHESTKLIAPLSTFIQKHPLRNLPLHHRRLLHLLAHLCLNQRIVRVFQKVLKVVILLCELLADDLGQSSHIGMPMALQRLDFPDRTFQRVCFHWIGFFGVEGVDEAFVVSGDVLSSVDHECALRVLLEHVVDPGYYHHDTRWRGMERQSGEPLDETRDECGR